MRKRACPKRKGISGSRSTVSVEKKSRCDLGDGTRGRMINASDRRQAVELITEAVDAGAALYKACAELGISKRTYNRWKNTDSDYIDKRTTCVRPEPANKMTPE